MTGQTQAKRKRESSKRGSGKGVATPAPQQLRFPFGDSANNGSLRDGASPGTTGLPLADAVRSPSESSPSNGLSEGSTTADVALSGEESSAGPTEEEAVANVSEEKGVPSAGESVDLRDAAPVENCEQAAAALVQVCNEVCGPVADGASGVGPTAHASEDDGVPLAEESVDLPDPDDREAGQWKRATGVISKHGGPLMWPPKVEKASGINQELLQNVFDFNGLHGMFSKMPVKRLRDIGAGVKLHRNALRMPKPKLVYQLVRWYRVTVVDDLVEDGDEEVSDGDEAQSHDEEIIEAMQEALDEDTRPTFPIFERTKIKK